MFSYSRCSGAVFEAEKLTVKDDVYHKRCFTCHRCSRALDSLIVSTSPDGEIYCKVDFWWIIKQVWEWNMIFQFDSLMLIRSIQFWYPFKGVLQNCSRIREATISARHDSYYGRRGKRWMPKMQWKGKFSLRKTCFAINQKFFTISFWIY